MNYPPYPNNPIDPSQPTMADQYPQWGQQPGQPSNPQWSPPDPTTAGQYPQWGQQAPPPPPPQYPQQPGQYSQSGQNFPQYPQQYPQQGQSGPPPYPPAQPPMQPPPIKPCSDAVLSIIFLLDIVCWICAFVPGGIGMFGKSVVTSIVFIMLIIDWKGVLTFDGKIVWKKYGAGKRCLLFCLYFIVLPFALIGYFVRRINASTEAKKQNLPPLPYRKGRPILALVVGFFVFIFALAANAAPAPDTTTTTTVAPTPTQQVTHAAPTAKPKVTPTPKPTTTPSPTPSPTPTPTPEPTQAPVQQQPVQQAPVQQSAPPPAQQQAPPPPATGVNGNPWGYNFDSTGGRLIYSPVSNFCSAGYFTCVSSFWTSTNGYVAECGNGDYTHSGGVKGACSKDGGVSQILYSH